MISILLAEAVLDQQGRISEVLHSNTDVTLYGKQHEFLGTYNIYELAHKCKEWAFWNDYYVITKMRMPDIYRDCQKIDYGFEVYQQDNISEHSWWLDTEPEAIFKACQWILDNKD
jgi:hypothetical protein